MLVTPRECNQVGRNSCTNAIRSIAVDPSNSSALSTLELLARDRRVSRARVESNGAGAGGGAGAGRHLNHAPRVPRPVPLLRVGRAIETDLTDFGAHQLAQPTHIAVPHAVQVYLEDAG